MKLKLVKKSLDAKETKTFFFKPDEKVDWLPGQFYYFTLDKLTFPDTKGATRHFTISTSATEKGLLAFTTRMREESGFKRTLDAMPIGSIVQGEGPSGTFIVDEHETEPQVLIAGGIGITPFRTIIKNAVDKKLKTPLYLIYSDSTTKDMAFRKELETWVKKHPSIQAQFILTSKDGRVDQMKIEKFIENWSLQISDCTFWVSGPPAMVEAVQKVLSDMGVHSSKIRSEEFTGY